MIVPASGTMLGLTTGLAGAKAARGAFFSSGTRERYEILAPLGRRFTFRSPPVSAGTFQYGSRLAKRIDSIDRTNYAGTCLIFSRLGLISNLYIDNQCLRFGVL